MPTCYSVGHTGVSDRRHLLFLSAEIILDSVPL